jgi:hypothetical protein
MQYLIPYLIGAVIGATLVKVVENYVLLRAAHIRRECIKNIILTKAP